MLLSIEPLPSVMTLRMPTQHERAVNETWQLWYSQHERAVLARAHKLCGRNRNSGRVDAHDVRNEVFLLVGHYLHKESSWKDSANGKRVPAVAKPRPFLLTITYRAHASLWRKPNNDSRTAPVDRWPDIDLRAKNQIDRVATSEVISKALEPLTRTQLHVLSRYVEGFTYEEIAIDLGVSRGSVSTTLARAKRKFTVAWHALGLDRSDI